MAGLDLAIHVPLQAATGRDDNSRDGPKTAVINQAERDRDIRIRYGRLDLPNSFMKQVR